MEGKSEGGGGGKSRRSPVEAEAEVGPKVSHRQSWGQRSDLQSMLSDEGLVSKGFKLASWEIKLPQCLKSRGRVTKEGC